MANCEKKKTTQNPGIINIRSICGPHSNLRHGVGHREVTDELPHGHFGRIQSVFFFFDSYLFFLEFLQHQMMKLLYCILLKTYLMTQQVSNCLHDGRYSEVRDLLCPAVQLETQNIYIHVKSIYFVCRGSLILAEVNMWAHLLFVHLLFEQLSELTGFFQPL